MEGRQERVEPLDRAYDLSSLSGEVEAVAWGDRSMQQCPTEGPSAGSPQPPAGPQASSTALAQILQQQAEEYRRAQQALDRHDLGAYQKAIEQLGHLIQQAQQLTEAPPPSTTAQAASPP